MKCVGLMFIIRTNKLEAFKTHKAGLELIVIEFNGSF